MATPLIRTFSLVPRVAALEGFHCILDCSQPMLSPNVMMVSTTGTTEGDTVTLQCEDGLFPEIPTMMMCNSAGVWSQLSLSVIIYQVAIL